ncbi:MAG: hypothetical protein ABIQ59_14000 [Nocardioidaceae bacterium]
MKLAGTLRPRPRRTTVTSALEWSIHYAVPLAGLVGALLYGVLRLAYVFFYLQVRTTPEEVGYGYVEILVGQFVGTVQVLLVLVLIYWLVAAAVAIALRRPRTWSLVLGSTAAACVTVVLGLPLLAWEEGAAAADGLTVRNLYVRPLLSRLPVLTVQAVPARVTSLDPSKPVTVDSECLMYLGRADGLSVFFDVRSRESVRLPSSAIVVTLLFTHELRGCEYPGS